MTSNNYDKFLHWQETNEADKINYFKERKHEIIEIFCRIKLPYKFYEVANILSIIYDTKSFDDYVSSLVYEEIENYVQDGTERIGDAILTNITGKETDWYPAEKEVSKSKEATTKEGEREGNNVWDKIPLDTDLGLPSREEVERRFGKIPDDSEEESKQDDNNKEDSNKIG